MNKHSYSPTRKEAGFYSQNNAQHEEAHENILRADKTSAMRQAITNPHRATPATILELQSRYGNQAVQRLLFPSRNRGPEILVRHTQEPPRQTCIAVSVQGGNKWGTHAWIYLAMNGAGEGEMDYYKIDLQYGPLRQEQLGFMAKAGQRIFGRRSAEDGDDERGIEIRVEPQSSTRNWPPPAASTTWSITDKQAEAALNKAKEFQQDAEAGKYWYSQSGLGAGGYNCSLFAEKILKAGGVQRSSGLMVSTPSELLTGKKGGSQNLANQKR